MVFENVKSITQKFVYSQKENVPKVQRCKNVGNPLCTPDFQSPIDSVKACLQDALIILIRSRVLKRGFSLAHPLCFGNSPAFIYGGYNMGPGGGAASARHVRGNWVS